MKKLAAVFVVATFLLNAIAPALAYAATYLQGAEVSADTLIQDAYVAVTYYDSKNKQKLEKGWIDAIDETSFTIRNGLWGKKTIAYDKVLSVIMSKEATKMGQMNEVNRWFIGNMAERGIEIEQAAIQRLNQKTVTVMPRGQIAPSEVTEGWYAYMVYTSQGATGKAASHIAFKYGADTYNIAYADIDTLIVAKHLRDIERYRETGAKYNARVRVLAPSIQKGQVVGRLIKMMQDTLVIQKEGKSKRIFGKLFGGVLVGGLFGFAGSLVTGKVYCKESDSGEICGLLAFAVGGTIGYTVGVPVGVSLSDPPDQFRYSLVGSLIGGAAGLGLIYAKEDFWPALIICPLIGSTIMSEFFRKPPEARRVSIGLFPGPKGRVSAVATLRF